MLKTDKNKNMKDYKNILILILLAGCLIFGYITLFSGDKNYKEQLKRLDVSNKILKEQRKAINSELLILKADYSKLKVHEAALADEVTALDKEVKKNKDAADRSKAELDTVKKDMEETRKKIADVKQNPANRTGEDLLNSLKIKTQK